MSLIQFVHFSNFGVNVVVLGSGAGGDVQGLMNSGLKVHAIKQDQKQPQAMMANLRTYKPSSQLWKLVPIAKFRGQQDPSEEDEKDEPLSVDVKCTKCEKETQAPPAHKCHSCGGHICLTCIPRSDVAECLVCGMTFRQVDIVVPPELAA